MSVYRHCQGGRMIARRRSRLESRMMLCDFQWEERQHWNLPVMLDVRRAKHDVVFDGCSGNDGITSPKIVG